MGRRWRGEGEGAAGVAGSDGEAGRQEDGAVRRRRGEEKCYGGETQMSMRAAQQEGEAGERAGRSRQNDDSTEVDSSARVVVAVEEVPVRDTEHAHKRKRHEDVSSAVEKTVDPWRDK